MASPRPAAKPHRQRRRIAVLALAGGGWALTTAGATRAEPAATPLPPAWQWAVVYKADLLHADAPRLATAVGNLSLDVDVDAARLFGWAGTTLHAEGLWNHGGKPNRRLGSVQGISNIEVADNAARLYSIWVERAFASTGTRTLFGLYDLNSEFYATEASALLIHPSFGIGAEFAQTGGNGPSIFPNLALALRLRQSFGGDGHYLQVAVLDGVAGDPDQPGRTVIRLRADDGALLVGEAGWRQPGAAARPGRWAVGAWHYTRRSERLDGSGTAQHNHGAYALVQALLHDGGSRRTTGFLRAGVAARHVNAVERAFDAGLLVEQPFGAGGPAALTAGIAVARLGPAARAAQAAEGRRGRATETALEFGARWQLTGGLALQPLLQRVWRTPGPDGSTAATVAGLRLEWTLSPR